MTAEPSAEDIIEAGRLIAPEHMRKEVKISTTVEQTIAKLTANSFQYATAGDSRRLIERLALLSRQVEELRKARDEAKTALQTMAKEFCTVIDGVRLGRTPFVHISVEMAVRNAALSSTTPETEKQ